MEEDEAKRIVESMTDSITRNDTSSRFFPEGGWGHWTLNYNGTQSFMTTLFYLKTMGSFFLTLIGVQTFQPIF